MSQLINFSIIIPAYMEARGITKSLETLAKFLDTRDYGAVEVIVVAADSKDGTASVAEKSAHLFKHFRVHRLGARVGKGRDVRAGMLEAKGKYRLFMDADLATPLHHLDDAYAALADGADVAIATRNLMVIHKQLLRKFMSSFGNIFAQVLILPGIRDTQCGFKAFEAEACKQIFRRQTMLGWSFDAEVLAVARLLGYKIATFDTPDWKDPKSEAKGLVGDSPIKAALQTFWDIIIIRLNIWTGRYRHPQSGL